MTRGSTDSGTWLLACPTRLLSPSLWEYNINRSGCPAPRGSTRLLFWCSFDLTGRAPIFGREEPRCSARLVLPIPSCFCFSSSLRRFSGQFPQGREATTAWSAAQSPSTKDWSHLWRRPSSRPISARYGGTIPGPPVDTAAAVPSIGQAGSSQRQPLGLLREPGSRLSPRRSGLLAAGLRRGGLRGGGLLRGKLRGGGLLRGGLLRVLSGLLRIPGERERDRRYGGDTERRGAVSPRRRAVGPITPEPWAQGPAAPGGRAEAAGGQRTAVAAAGRSVIGPAAEWGPASLGRSAPRGRPASTRRSGPVGGSAHALPRGAHKAHRDALAVNLSAVHVVDCVFR
eukprot:scaffold1382_cov127-Isochrysis_galbana.AAC.3